MISVPNRRQLLNGSRFAVICIALFLSSCAKKTAPVSRPAEEKTEVRKEPDKKVEERIVVNSMALLLPFNLDKIDPKTATRKQIDKADLAIDFYQGYKLALDSLSAEGNHFKLQVLDSRESELQIVNLARSRSVMENDLIIGPIFPESIKTFSEFANLKNKLQVSPLAATDPGQFQNENLVTMTSTIDQHGRRIAGFITKKYRPRDIHVVLINTRSSDDEKFAAPVRDYLNEFSKNNILIHEIANAIGLEEHLSASKLNLVIIAPTGRDFLLPTIDRLHKLGLAGLKIEVFGHPNWAKAQFLNAEKMQWLNTRITSSYYVNYQLPKVKQFIARYMDEYGFDPNEFAFKGFDTGYFFGKLLARYGSDYARHITDATYEGLHNRFKFEKANASGYLNSELMILKYQGFELKIEE